MALSTTARNAAAQAIATGAAWVSVHTGDPGTTGANEDTTVPRKQTTWGSPSGGDIVGSQVAADISGSGGGPYTHFGLWSAVTGGTFWGGGTLSPAETFAGAGQLRVTPTIDG
jgi:hypothetical protein